MRRQARSKPSSSHRDQRVAVLAGADVRAHPGQIQNRFGAHTFAGEKSLQAVQQRRLEQRIGGARLPGLGAVDQHALQTAVTEIHLGGTRRTTRFHPHPGFVALRRGQRGVQLTA